MCNDVRVNDERRFRRRVREACSNTVCIRAIIDTRNCRLIMRPARLVTLVTTQFQQYVPTIEEINVQAPVR